LASWFFIHYRKSVTSNTFQFLDDSESKSAINKTFCGHRLHRFKKIKSDLLFSNAEWNHNRERGKSKYLDNISVLPTSIFIFDKFVDGGQPEVACEIVVAGTFWEPCIVVVSFVGGGHQSTWRKPLTCRMSLKNFHHIILY
jgi:hypothetical protein